MKRVFIVLAALAGAGVVAVLGSFFWSACTEAQRADYGWSPRVASPAHTSSHPVVLFDEGHHNASTAGFEGRYWPFGKLLRADGYELRRGTKRFTREYLREASVLVVANAAGGGTPVAFGINVPLPGGDLERRGDPAILRGAAGAGGADDGAVARVMTFTGQSLDGPPSAAVLLRVPENAVEYVP
ncbi:MAG TPA: hypothetical protein VLT84_12810, partial [Acidobacteriota bacterium]|nr:hypothetical protein [Acidobacteriota bacterium]